MLKWTGDTMWVGWEGVGEFVSKACSRMLPSDGLSSARVVSWYTEVQWGQGQGYWCCGGQVVQALASMGVSHRPEHTWHSRTLEHPTIQFQQVQRLQAQLFLLFHLYLIVTDDNQIPSVHPPLHQVHPPPVYMEGQMMTIQSLPDCVHRLFHPLNFLFQDIDSVCLPPDVTLGARVYIISGYIVI